MIGYAPFLGQVRLVISPVRPSLGQLMDRSELERKLREAERSGDDEMANYYRHLLETGQYMPYRPPQAYPVTYPFPTGWEQPPPAPPPSPPPPPPTPRPTPPPVPTGGPAYPVTYPWPTEAWEQPPPRPPVQTPRSPMRTGNIPEGAYLPTPTPGTQQAQGLPCPEGQYRPPGGAWCVPIPIPEMAPRRIPTVPFGSLFSGGLTSYGGSFT